MSIMELGALGEFMGSILVLGTSHTRGLPRRCAGHSGHACPFLGCEIIGSERRPRGGSIGLAGP